MARCGTCVGALCFAVYGRYACGKTALVYDQASKTGGWRERDFSGTPDIFFCDQYFACMDQAAVYGVGMWIAGQYTAGLPYLIFAMNKYREHIRPYEQKKEEFNEGRVLGVLDALMGSYERRPKELKERVQHLTDMISENWMDYIM